VKKKTAPAAGSLGRHLAPIETNLLKDHMALVEHMAVTRYDDQDPREIGWITIKTVGAAWQVQVKDPDTGNSFAVIAETLDKAIDAAALLLSCDDAPWAPDAFLKAKKKK
jgi:hypothetical protein